MCLDELTLFAVAKSQVNKGRTKHTRFCLTWLCAAVRADVLAA